MAERASATEPEHEPPPVPSSDAPTGRSLPLAVVTALALLALLIGAYLAGRGVFFVVICGVVLAALFEALDGLRQASHRVNIPWGVLCGFGLLFAAYRERPELFGAVVAIAMFGAFVLALRPGRGASPATDVAWTVLPVIWLGGGGAGATTIMMLEPDGKALLVAFVLTTALDDIGGYFAGTWFGRHKLAPSISPAKSWEGVLGGLVMALAGGILFAALIESLEPTDGLALGALSAVLAPMGDLVESMFKRELGIKDSGRLLPGHGGFLDRLDAILFCAPAAALLLTALT